jgi:hypothetical protein
VLDYTAYLDENTKDSYVDGLSGGDKVNTGVGTSAPVADADTLQLADKGTDSSLVHASYSSDSSGVWTLGNWNAKLTSQETDTLKDQGNDQDSTTPGETYADAGSQTLTDQQTLAGNGDSATDSEQETLVDNYNGSYIYKTPPAGSTAPGDSNTGSDNYVLNQTLDLGTGGSVTVVCGTLSDTALLSDADRGKGDFTLLATATGPGAGTSVTPGTGDNFTPVSSSGSSPFNIPFDGSADWLTNYADTVSGDIQAAVANPTSGPAPAVSSTYTTTGAGSEWVQASAASTRTLDYNLAGQVLSDKTADGSGNILQYNVYVYDGSGHKTFRHRWHLVGSGPP